MTLSRSRSQIHCDGNECPHSTTVPVGLRSTLNPDGAETAAAGWLFIQHGRAWRHYCPQCGRSILQQFDGDREFGPRGPEPTG
jgi:predicted RNA-binding Zn-ribbon protein involved in translation (DUF1610 family)